MFCEIDDRQFDDPNPDSFDTYYGSLLSDHPYHETARSRAGFLMLLGNLKKKLEAAYPDCAPLRKQLHRIDMSAELIGRIKVTDG
jgi:hypothetical protein